jgi:hypothetical protein
MKQLEAEEGTLSHFEALTALAFRCVESTWKCAGGATKHLSHHVSCFNALTWLVDICLWRCARTFSRLSLMAWPTFVATVTYLAYILKGWSEAQNGHVILMFVVCRVCVSKVLCVSTSALLGKIQSRWAWKLPVTAHASNQLRHEPYHLVPDFYNRSPTAPY